MSSVNFNIKIRWDLKEQNYRPISPRNNIYAKSNNVLASKSNNILKDHTQWTSGIYSNDEVLIASNQSMDNYINKLKYKIIWLSQ